MLVFYGMFTVFPLVLSGSICYNQHIDFWKGVPNHG